MAKAKTSDAQNSLENFSWDTSGSSDFFGVKGTSVATSKEEMDKIISDMADDDDDDAVTALTTDTKGKAKAAKVEVEEEDDDNDDADEEGDDNEEGAEGEEDDDDNEEGKEDDDEGEEQHSFFGQKPEGEDDDEDDKVEDPKDKKKDKVKKGEDGKDKSKKDKVKSQDTPAATKQTDGQFFKTLATEMKERGVFQNVDIPEDKEELEVEEFFELHDKEIESRVDETFEAFFQEMDDDGKDFLKFKKNGGRSVDFINVYANSPVPEFDGEFDANNENHRVEVLETYLALVEKMDAEELKDRLEWLKENGKEKVYAEKYYDKLVAIDTAQKAALLKRQEDANKERENNVKKFNKTIVDVLTKVEKVGNFKITKEDKKKLGDAITKPTVKVGKNKYVPSFNSKLGAILKADTPEAQQKLILLAKLVESDFDITDLANETQTKVVKGIKSKLKDVKNGVRPSSSGNHTRRSLADFFPDNE